MCMSPLSTYTTMQLSSIKVQVLSGRNIAASPQPYIRRWETKDCGQSQWLVWLKVYNIEWVLSLSMVSVFYLGTTFFQAVKVSDLHKFHTSLPIYSTH